MKKPNVVMFLTDDQGAWALHCAGNDDIITPNLDQMAARGVRFENFFCASPVCSPARASIVTGRMPSAHGVHDWLNGGNVDTDKYPHMMGTPQFNKEDKAIEYLQGQVTYVEKLAEAGYHCGLSGKWHLGNNAMKKAGFEKWYALGHGGCNYKEPDVSDEGVMSSLTEYTTDLFTDKAIEYMTEWKDLEDPFYVSIHYNAPHSPWEIEHHKKEHLDLYKDCEFKATPVLPVHEFQIDSCPVGDTQEHRRANLTGYYAAITAVDENVGKVYAFLEKHDLLDNTVVIFTADNGMNMGHHGVWGKGNGTYPPNMYEESIKVPCLIEAPFIKETGLVSTKVASHCDLFGTFMNIAGLDYKPGTYQCGGSLYPYLCGEDTESKEIYMHDEYGFVRMIRTENYKLVYRYKGFESELYDLKHDIEETKNLYGDADYQEIVQEMLQKLEDWFITYTDPKFDAHLLEVTGKGQKDWCYKEDTFTQTYRYFHQKSI
ncbi:MAG: sulfatase-like hydrolase/transferase [Lachnospiraceae bacterium]